MSQASDNSRRWLERELKNVALPAELVARLKQIRSQGGGDDAEALLDRDIERALCNVPMPAGLAESLKAIPADYAIDRRLSDVAVPDSLRERLREIPVYGDEALAAELRAVPVPDSLPAKLRSPAQPERARRQWVSRLATWAVAASLMIAVGLAYFSALGAAIVAVYRPSGPSRGASPEDGSIELDTTPDDSSLSQLSEAIRLTPAEQSPALAVIGPIDPPLPPTPDPRPFDEVERLFAAEAGEEPAGMLDAFRYKFLLGYAPTSEADVELEQIRRPEPRGVRPPAGLDGEALLDYLVSGLHPFVSPGAGRSTSRPPLSTSTASFEAVRLQLEKGRVPTAGEVRTEDFLAAIDYRLMRPAGRPLSVHTAAGPAPFAEEDTYLLQIAVQAGSDPNRPRSPTHLTIALDASSSLARQGRLQRVEQAIERLMGDLQQEDRLSLVAFDEQADVLVTGARRTDRQALGRALGSLRPGGVANFATGLRQAALAAWEESPSGDFTKRLVLVSGGLGDLPEQEVERLAALCGEVRESGLRTDLVHLGATPVALQKLRAVADAGGGRFAESRQVSELRLALAEALAGGTRVIAREAGLTVYFESDAVEAYRLVGHEANSAGGLVGGPLAADLREGETATVLYEVKLKPGGGNEVARVELAWKDPDSGRRQTLEPRVSRLQFATSVLESPQSLQWALVAAEAAEALRGVDAERNEPAPGLQRFLNRNDREQRRRNQAARLREIQEFAQQLPLRTRQNESFADLLTVIDWAHRVLSGRPLPERR